MCGGKREISEKLSQNSKEGNEDNDGKTSTYKSTVNALGHINIISGSPPGPVLPLFGVNRDGLRRTRCLAQFTGDAPFVPTGITAQGVLPSEAGGKVPLLVRVIDGDFRFEGDFTGEPEGTPDFGHEEDFGGAFKNVLPGCLDMNLIRTYQEAAVGKNEKLKTVIQILRKIKKSAKFPGAATRIALRVY